MSAWSQRASCAAAAGSSSASLWSQRGEAESKLLIWNKVIHLDFDFLSDLPGIYVLRHLAPCAAPFHGDLNGRLSQMISNHTYHANRCKCGFVWSGHNISGSFLKKCPFHTVNLKLKSRIISSNKSNVTADLFQLKLWTHWAREGPSSWWRAGADPLNEQYINRNVGKYAYLS